MDAHTFSLQSDMKKTITQNPDKYVDRDDRAIPMLRQLRQNGKQTFLLTNSDWGYTDVWRSSFIPYLEYLDNDEIYRWGRLENLF